MLSGLFGKTREGYYAVSRQKMNERSLLECNVVDIVRQIRSEAPGIGAYKMFLILRGIYQKKMMGRDRFYELMHRKHLMLPPVRCRHTTNSNHNYRKYKNLIKGFTPTAPSQLWVADITYIETDEGVCYLHHLVDAFTHEIIGWTLSGSLKASGTLAALEQAVEQARDPIPQVLIHHSDRGSQYCCNQYVDRLKELGIRISMTEDSNPTDNAIAERMNGIIKQEWLYKMKRPHNLEQARHLLERIVDFYNNKRPHMSNGMKTPAQMRKLYGALFGGFAPPAAKANLSGVFHNI